MSTTPQTPAQARKFARDILRKGATPTATTRALGYPLSAVRTTNTKTTKRAAPTVADDLAAVLSDLLAMRSQCFIPNDGDWWDNKARQALNRYQDEKTGARTRP